MAQTKTVKSRNMESGNPVSEKVLVFQPKRKQILVNTKTHAKRKTMCRSSVLLKPFFLVYKSAFN